MCERAFYKDQVLLGYSIETCQSSSDTACMSGPGQRRPAGCTGPQAPAGARTVSFLGGKQAGSAASSRPGSGH